VILGIALVISAGSIVYTNILVEQIKDREKRQMDLYAATLEYLANELDAPNLIFVHEEIIQANRTIPVILTDEFGRPEHFRNIPGLDELKDPKEREKLLEKEIEKMQKERDPIMVTLIDDVNQVYGYKNIYYRNSKLLEQLRYYPYVQLSIISIFGLIVFGIFNYSRRAEQNRVWVGLAKETAHQLGTPLSSLMAWVEYFKETFPEQKEIFDELQKDVDRLEMITERFSNIGSVPKLSEGNVFELVSEVMKYLQTRISKKVVFSIEAFPTEDIRSNINRPLFAWVIENIVKNAVDAMDGIGSIHIKIMKVSEGQVAVDISDSGKGITKANIKDLFKPGFTTKRRGWGLGLALAKRIVENYHGGKIFVKSSEINKGTTFRIMLKS
jgi:two-component sensor histidine kinase